MYKKFCAVFAGASASLLLLIFALNFLVDPYDVWENERYTGVNLYAIRSENRERLLKPIHVLKDKPDAIFLGNSKCDFSLDPEHFKEITGIEKTYNMAVRNGLPYEFRKYVEMAVNNNPDLKTIILTLDYDMFREPVASMPGFDEEQTRKKHITRSNLVSTTLSMDASIDSLITLKENHDYKYEFPTYEKDGKLSEGALYTIFSDEASFYKNTRLLVVDQFLLAKHPNIEAYNEKFKDIERIVDLCNERGIELKVVVLPAHAIHLDSYDSSWQRYEDWARRLAEIVPFVCFNLYNEITMSNPGTDSAGNEYFWDTAHIKQNVGNLVLDYIYDRPNADIPSNFAFAVNAGNVNEYLAVLKNQHIKWEAENRQMKERLASMGRFVQVCPAEIINKDMTLNEEFVQTMFKTKESRLNHDQILYFDGTLGLSPTDVKGLYAVLEDNSGRKFYAMANKKWRKDEAGVSVLLKNKNEQEPYEFLTGAILADVPQGEYELRLISVMNNGDTAYISPSLQKVVIVEI